MPKRDNETLKAQVIADLTAGEQPAVVAERYGIDARKVRMWKSRYVAAVVAPTVAPIAPQQPHIQPSVVERQQRIGELVLELLAAKLEASKAIAQQAHDPAWRFAQRAGELAALGQWLDSTAFALGDRLAGTTRSADDADPDDDSR